MNKWNEVPGDYEADIVDIENGYSIDSTAKEQLEAMKQQVTMLIIDKKRMKLKDAGLPQMVIDQTPKYLRGSKLPIVKAKVGPRIMVPNRNSGRHFAGADPHIVQKSPKEV